MSPPPALVCEILAPQADLTRALSETAHIAASSVGQPIIVKTHVIAIGGRDDVIITLHLPVTQAAGQDQVWCLGCRLACLCPQARVSVLIHGEDTFVLPHAHPPRQRPA